MASIERGSPIQGPQNVPPPASHPFTTTVQRAALLLDEAQRAVNGVRPERGSPLEGLSRTIGLAQGAMASLQQATASWGFETGESKPAASFTILTPYDLCKQIHEQLDPLLTEFTQGAATLPSGLQGSVFVGQIALVSVISTADAAALSLKQN